MATYITREAMIPLEGKSQGGLWESKYSFAKCQPLIYFSTMCFK